ncbi:MAG TPA: penicillin acylase family protein [Thermoanaerobaculia bacterium]
MIRSFGLAILLTAFSVSAQDMPIGRMTRLSGMQQPGMLIREANGIPHIFALNTHDAWFLNGWLHAQDRFFQMDTNRRIASGTLGEVLGSAALSNDVQLRTLGLRRAAEATLPTVSAEARAALDAYTQGVNAYLQAHPGQLPPEYSLLGIQSVPAWTAVDTLAIAKLLAFGLSFDNDTDTTVALISDQTAGKIVGFDGSKLFSDTWRSAPFSKAATIPDATGAGGAEPIKTNAAVSFDTSWIKPETIELLLEYRQQISGNDVMQSAIDPDRHAGSNEWAIAPRNSATGNALIANDPHLSLSEPPNFYPISVRVPGKLNVAGMGFPGVPFVIQGQNERIAWGSTVHPMDVTDLYQEQIVPESTSPSGLATMYLGKKENVIPIPQVYRVWTPGSGMSTVPSSPSTAATLMVPRHGPVLSLNMSAGTAVTVQYAGFYPTHEAEAFMLIDQAKSVEDFKNAIQFFDVGSQNFAYADVDGNIAYFTSGEMPIREDLQAGKVTGLPPYFLRNGTGGNEWMAVAHPQPQQTLPFEILPFSEMPQVVNPSNGWFVNANNDPIGQTLDNDPLNSLRPGGGIYYLNPGYDGIRAGRITQLVRQKLAGGGKLSVADMQSIQADTVLLDAEVFVPFIVTAMTNARAAGADPTLAALGANPIVAASVAQLAAWDFSTPTGIDTGYDASETNGALTSPSQTEISNSVAATIFAAWRSKFLANTIDTVLKTLTLPLPPQQPTLSALRFQLENFNQTGGRGSSGLNFFNVPMVNDAAVRRDILILKSIADGMTMLASDDFAAAFNKSANLSDYRWGKLHRVVFAHLMGNLYSPGAPFGQLPLPSLVNLPGVGTDGGMSTVDASSHNARANTVNGFMFTSGPNRRYVGNMQPGFVQGQSSLPGGVSGDARSPWFTNLLMQWLTNDTFPVVPDTFPRIPWLP